MGICGRCLSVWGTDSHTPPSYILNTSIQYTYSNREGGGRDEPEIMLEGLQFTKLGRKYQYDWQYLQSINSDEHMP